MAAEMPEMQDTIRAAAIAYRYGMKVDTYIQWNIMDVDALKSDIGIIKSQANRTGRPHIHGAVWFRKPS